jgi:hypothetical protein
LRLYIQNPAVGSLVFVAEANVNADGKGKYADLDSTWLEEGLEVPRKRGTGKVLVFMKWFLSGKRLVGNAARVLSKTRARQGTCHGTW